MVKQNNFSTYYINNKTFDKTIFTIFVTIEGSYQDYQDYHTAFLDVNKADQLSPQIYLLLCLFVS